jgi:hypothetical protein
MGRVSTYKKMKQTKNMLLNPARDMDQPEKVFKKYLRF